LGVVKKTFGKNGQLDPEGLRNNDQKNEQNQNCRGRGPASVACTSDIVRVVVTHEQFLLLNVIHHSICRALRRKLGNQEMKMARKPITMGVSVRMLKLKRIRLLAVLIAIALLGLEVWSGREEPQDYEDEVLATHTFSYILNQKAKVVSVTDGDTFTIRLDDGSKEKVRLILIDTPEMSPEEPYGPEASAFTRKLLQDKKVTLEFDKSERDRYGRLLAYAYIGEEMVNELLLEKGLARVAVFPPDVRYEERFRDIERKAQAAGLGIWSVE